MSNNDANSQAPRKVNAAAMKLIQDREGFVDHVHLPLKGKDPNPTIGYGHQVTVEDLIKWLNEGRIPQESRQDLQKKNHFSDEDMKDEAKVAKALLKYLKENPDAGQKLTMTNEEAQKQLEKDVAKAAGQVDDFAKENGINLTDNQFGALVSLVYNLTFDEVFYKAKKDNAGKVIRGKHGQKIYDYNQKTDLHQKLLETKGLSGKALEDKHKEVAKQFLEFAKITNQKTHEMVFVPGLYNRRDAEQNLYLTPDESPAQQPLKQVVNQYPAPAPLSAIELYAREMAASRANVVQAQSSGQVVSDLASPGTAVDHPRFTTESQWIDYIIGMLVDMLSKPRVFYYHITIETELEVLSRFSVALTMDWSGNLLSCQRLDHGNSYCGIIGPPEKIVASQGARTFIC